MVMGHQGGEGGGDQKNLKTTKKIQIKLKYAIFPHNIKISAPLEQFR